MANLLQETLSKILSSGYTPDQIIFIGSEQTGHQCTFEEFKKMADIEYDSSYGAQKVAKDLVIVFSDGAKMWRGEYDGAEWWELYLPFKDPEIEKKITSLIVNDGGWRTLAEIQSD